MHGLWHRFRSASRGAAARRRFCALNVEYLEYRQLLSGGQLGNALANVTYHGGPLLQHVQVESVYYGQAWSTDANLQQQTQQLDSFLTYFTDSPYMDVLKQYNVGHGTFTGHDIIAQNPPGGKQMDDSQIRAALDAEIATGHLPAPTPDRLYVFFTAPGVVVTANGQNSVNDFAGYHDAFTDKAGAAVYYAVVPYPTGNVTRQRLTDFQQDTVVLSHEVSEGITDPDTQTGWFDARRGEIGDLAAGQTGLLHGYVVQAVWSQAAGKAVIPTDTTSTTLHVTGTTLQATAGQPLTGIVATITGADPHATAASFTATIDWSDGHTSDGTITPDPKGGFDVTGTHTYATESLYPITVTVHDQNGAVVGTALSKASAAPAPPTLDAKGKLLGATAGQSFSGVVATFTDVNSQAAVGDFTATIDWGDGTTSAGTIVADPKGGFDVTGTHTYANGSQSGGGVTFGGFGFGLFGPLQSLFGTQYFVVAVTIHDNPVHSTATALSLARVAPTPPSITAQGQNIQATAGKAFSGGVATFIATDPNATAASFMATIAWGDGTTSAGTITADPKGGFDVTGSHTYPVASYWGGFWFGFGLRDQQFVVRVTITAQQTKDQATTKSVATVAPAPPNLSVTAQNIVATAGKTFSGVVATFTDVDPKAAADGFTATINWGDGTTSNGTITADPKGGFDITGTHTYTDITSLIPEWDDFNLGFEHSGHTFGLSGDSLTLTVTVKSKTSRDTATAQALAAVTPASANLQASGTQIDAVFGKEFSGTVATFTPANANATASGFTASINWGDGTTSDGTIVADPKGGFDVTGTHTYTDTDGSGTGSDWPHWPHISATNGRSLGNGKEAFIVTTTIQDKSDNSTALAVSLASVTPTPPNIVTTNQTLSLNAGQQFSGTVASFTDADGNGAASFKATIEWGDGTTSDGTITAGAKGGFDVGGTHTYAAGGTYSVLVRIRDTDGDSAVSLSTATVADGTMPPSLTTVDMAFVQSAEFYGNLIIKDYQQYLSRTPGNAEVAAWVNAMQHGATDQQVLAGFFNSPEYYLHAGNSDKAWVDAMYRDLLGRNADATGENAWMQALAAGAKKADIALGFATSQEREGGIVQNYYQQYLGRTAGAAEVAGWVRAFETGQTNEQIIAGIVGSQEYFQKQNANTRDWLFSVYQNLLSRKPDQSGYDGWLGVLSAKQR
jgi:hypothetical protein